MLAPPERLLIFPSSEILDAYGVLRDPQKRTIYDASGPAAFVRGARARSQGPRPDIDDSDSDIDDNDIDEILDEILREIRKSQRSAAARGRRGNFSFENANLIRQRPSSRLHSFSTGVLDKNGNALTNMGKPLSNFM